MYTHMIILIENNDFMFEENNLIIVLPRIVFAMKLRTYNVLFETTENISARLTLVVKKLLI